MAMVQVTAEFRIESDTHSWVIQRRRWGKDRKTGQKKWVWAPERWYSTFSDAVNGLGQVLLRESDADTLPALRDEAERIDALLSGLREVKERSIHEKTDKRL